MATKPQKPVAMCCVTIGYMDFLMPADRGLRVVELMKDAVACDNSFDRSRGYVIREEQLEISMTIVRASQIRKSTPDFPAPMAPQLLLGND